MIDLRFESLPDTIEVDGRDYRLDTDFRTWLEASRSIEEDGVFPFSVFADEVPEGDSWVEPATEFLLSRNETPRGKGGTERVLDYLSDGDYIVAAFQQVYGIDLTSIEGLHWHRFLALLRGLPQECKLSEIIGYRSWHKTSANYDSRMQRMRSMWELPTKKSDEKAAIAYQQAAFGKVVEEFAKGNGD